MTERPKPVPLLTIAERAEISAAHERRVATLENKLAARRLLVSTLKHQRHAAAIAFHADGDAKAGKLLTEIHLRQAALDNEIADITAALAEVRARQMRDASRFQREPAASEADRQTREMLCQEL
jgi:hypothetical protein